MEVAVKRRGGNRKPQQFRNCAQCGTFFGPIDHLAVKFCSYACKVKAQATGRKARRVPTQAARNAQRIIRYHVQAGNIRRASCCEECGAMDRRIEAAHRDYSRPLDIRWLCRSCHVRWDKAQPKGGTVRVDEGFRVQVRQA